MSQGSYSFARTRSARVARQSSRERIASFFYELAPAMVAPVVDRNLSVTQQALPDYGMWARARTAEGKVVYHPLGESIQLRVVPGIRRRVLRVHTFRTTMLS